MEQKNGLISTINSISLFLLGILFMTFPIVLTTITTNPIVLPKQVLLGGIVSILLTLQAIKILIERSVKLRRTYFDIPILLLAATAFLSAVLAVNRADSLTTFVPYFFAILCFFLIVNIVKDKNSLLFLMFSVAAGAVLLSAGAVLSFFKIYLLPFEGTHSQTFTPLGSLLEQAIYLFTIFGISAYYTYRSFRHKGVSAEAGSASSKPKALKIVGFGAASFVILLGIIVTVYSIIKIEKTPILPIQVGFQTAFSQISLDSGRLAQSFLLGSGIGTYAIDFSRWKQPSFNQHEDLWNLTFFRSSNLPLELLATTGVLGLCAFLFLLIRAVREIKTSSQNKMSASLILILAMSFLLPLSFATQTLLFIILGLFAANQVLLSKTQNRFFDIELQLVAFKKGLIAMEPAQTRNDKSLVLPSFVGLVILAIVGVVGYYGVLYTMSDLTFQRSLVAASQNNGSLTYQLQSQALNTFKYRDGFYRVFSQTNLALANSLASQQPAGQAPDAVVQQNITTLIQQSINSARAATTVAPQTFLNWQNLSSVYRSLIGFGQNAESFAIATARQSVSLDPNNPQQYITLGGIYYQLGQWDNAQSQFQIAVALKPEYANAYYNLGHALEQKGDLQNALAQYQKVKSLVGDDKVSLEQVTKEIEALQNRTATEDETSNSPALTIDTPETQLPPRTPKVEIPAPEVSTNSAN